MAALIPAMSAAGTLAGGVGALLGGIGGSKGKSSGGQRPLPYLARGTEALAGFGQNLAKQPYEAYTGPRVAGFSPDTQAAFEMIRANTGVAAPWYQQALGAAGGLSNFGVNGVGNVNASQWAGQDLSPYMNPYTQQVIDAQAADQQNAYGQAYNNLASQAQAAKAFGGSRFGVAQGQLAADSVRNQALLSAQLRSQGFDTAAGLLSQDVASQNWAKGLNADIGLQNNAQSIQSAQLRGNAANSLGLLAGQYQGSLGQDAQSLAGAGAAQQALSQQQMDVGYGDYMDRTRTYPAYQLGLWQNALSPALQQYAIRNQTPTTNTGGGLLGALGGAQLGAQAGNSIYDWWKGNQQPIGLTQDQLNNAYTQLDNLDLSFLNGG